MDNDKISEEITKISLLSQVLKNLLGKERRLNKKLLEVKIKITECIKIINNEKL